MWSEVGGKGTEDEWSGGWGQGVKELPDVEIFSFVNESSSSLPSLNEPVRVCVCFQSSRRFDSFLIVLSF